MGPDSNPQNEEQDTSSYNNEDQSFPDDSNSDDFSDGTQTVENQESEEYYNDQSFPDDSNSNDFNDGTQTVEDQESEEDYNDQPDMKDSDSQSDDEAFDEDEDENQTESQSDQDSDDENNASLDDDAADLENEDLDSYDGSSHGSIPDSHDSRDKAFIAAKPTSPPIRPAGHKGVDLRSYCPDVYDQGKMMSCTANAVAAAFEFEVMKQNLPSFVPSRLFIWYNARAKTNIRDATRKNCGCSIREAIKSLDMRSHGVCSEEDWSYEVAESDKQTLYFVDGAKAAKKPPRVVYQHAHQHTAPKYFSFQTKGNRLLNDLVNCLDRGYPFVFGMSTYGLLKNVTSDGEGLKMPTQNMNGKPRHGHSLVAVGYNPDRKRFIVRNSWGPNWGDNGYFTMSYKYMTSNHCYDFWTVRLVSGKPKNNA